MSGKLRIGLGGLAALGAASTAYVFLVRPWHLRWGASDDEVRRPMAGDDEVPNPILQATRAVTIAAPPEAVWPWLVQMGYGRAGFYGFDFIDNSGIDSAERIIPELQDLEVGDRVPTSPMQGLTVKALEPNRSMVLAMHGEGSALSASIALRELDIGHTRLVVRLRAWWRLGLRQGLFFLLFEPGDFLNMRRQLLGIKRRAEGEWDRQRRAEAMTTWSPEPPGAATE